MPAERGRAVTLVSMAVVLLATAAMPRSARGLHEEGMLKVASRVLVAGDSVRVVGEKFDGGMSLTLMLVGLSGRASLGDVRTDGTGTFSQLVAVPADLAAGGYRLIAFGSDGDEAAALDVTVAPARAGPAAGAAEITERDAEPTDEPLALDRARRSGVTGGAIVGIVLALLAGGALLRRPADSA